MKNIFKIALVLTAGVLASNCTYRTAVQSTQGKAWITKMGMVNSAMYNCDAAGGQPTCYKVTEVPR